LTPLENRTAVDSMFDKFRSSSRSSRHPLGRDMSTALHTRSATRPLIRPTGRPAGRADAARRTAGAASLDRSTVVLSATSFGVDAEVRGLERPRVPNYALRRLIVGVAFTAVCMLGLLVAVGVLAGFGGIPASASGVQPAQHSATMSIHVAEPGDTLWSIANAHRGDIDHARYLDVLVRLNGGTGVEAGQAVWLP
jgi:hypothetical protein